MFSSIDTEARYNEGPVYCIFKLYIFVVKCHATTCKFLFFCVKNVYSLHTYMF